jgi:two-component system, cell cycle sensor histidine kinase and response regulator CckA
MKKGAFPGSSPLDRKEARTMKDIADASPDAKKLRKKAEAILKEKQTEKAVPSERTETEKLLHELQVHQIELEMQNEELLNARNHAETSLAKYTELYDFAPTGYFTLNRDGVICELNLTGAALLGSQRASLVNKNFKIFVSAETRSLFIEFLQKVFESTDIQSCEIVLAAGGITPLLANIQGIASDGGQNCLLLAEDITERRNKENAARAAQMDYYEIFNAVNDAIFIHDIQTGAILDINRKMSEMYGYTPEEIQLLDIGTLSSGEPSHPQNEALFWIKMAIEGTPQIFEWKARRKDGELFWVEVNLKQAVIGGKDRILAIVRDITERKNSEAERRKMGEKLLQTQKLESLGVLAGGIAHDFNNLLMAVVGNIDLTLNVLTDDSSSVKYLTNAMKACMNAAGLCTQMLDYAGKGRFMVRDININNLITGMEKILSVSISKHAQINYDLNPDLPKISGDEAQIQQVIMNLLINASEAIGENYGTIAVSTGVMECDDFCREEMLLGENLKPGPYVYLDVTDTGCGMDDKTRDRMFEPFYTTKFMGRGLGMSAVMGILRGHGGGIRVISGKGQGTSFRVVFPAVIGNVKPEQPEPEPEKVLSFTGAILLVDDEEGVRDVGHKMLSSLGFEVFMAASGSEAVEIYKKNRDNISCVILDLTMPRMSGVQTLEEIWKINPDLCVIISSGYGEETVKASFKNKKISGFIKKPYLMDSLKKKLIGAI